MPLSTLSCRVSFEKEVLELESFIARLSGIRKQLEFPLSTVISALCPMSCG